MSTLWLDHRDLELRLEPGALVPYIAGMRRRPAPLSLLQRVVVIGNCQLEARIIAALAASGIAVSIINPRKPERRAWLCGPAHGDATIRIAQLSAFQDPHLRRRIATDIVHAKLRRLLRLTQRMRAQRPDAGLTLKKSVDQLQAALKSLPATAPVADAAPALPTLRGIEGAASRAGFSALAAVLPPSLGFDGRKRRPPPDPANAALSLAYTLLHHRAAQTAWAFGLDPLIGFFHEPAHGRESLAADLIEPWRPAAEEWVWRLFAERRLRQSHFRSQKDGACLLGKAGRRIFYQSFERDLAPVFRAMRLQVRQLVRFLRRQAPLIGGAAAEPGTEAPGASSDNTGS